jgi:hypothetical protein
MIVVIQCAAGKRADAGSLRTDDGRNVLFVADPTTAPAVSGQLHARPDDLAYDGRTWREHLVAYNESGENPLGLSTAFELYEHPAYRRLVKAFGVDSVFILSAGWGLIRAGFLTPLYDITFSSAVKKAAPWKHRHRTDRYRDLRQLPGTCTDEIVFLGGKDYVPLFCELTNDVAGERSVFYNSDTPPRAPGCKLERFHTRTRTNWHYECARALAGATESTTAVNDDHVLAAFTRCVEGGVDVELEVVVITWPQPHTPRSVWTVAARLPANLGRTTIEQHRRKLLDRPDLFGICSLCSERKPAGWMHDRHVCQGCAERTMQAVY